MTLVAIEDMPPTVYRPYSYLLDETGVEAVVQRKGFGRMELVHASKRVRMTISFRLRQTKWAWTGSTLTVDGKRVPLATSWDMYVAIFKDPDAGRRSYVPKGAKKAQLPDTKPVDDDRAPTAVLSAIRELRQMVGKGRDITVDLGIENAQRYVLSVTNRKDDSKILYFYRPGDGGWVIEGIRLVSPTGYDITDYHADEIDGYILEFLGVESRGVQRPEKPLGSEQKARVSNSVMVRKATVFRI